MAGCREAQETRECSLCPNGQMMQKHCRKPITLPSNFILHCKLLLRAIPTLLRPAGALPSTQAGAGFQLQNARPWGSAELELGRGDHHWAVLNTDGVCFVLHSAGLLPYLSSQCQLLFAVHMAKLEKHTGSAVSLGKAMYTRISFPLC